MMELNSSIIQFLNLVNEEPVFIVFGVAFGMPLFMFVYAMTISKLYRKAYFSTTLNIIVFTTLGGTWLLGFILMMLLFFSNVSGIKLFIILILLFVFILIFVLINFASVNKFINEQVDSIKQKNKSKS